MEETKLCDLSCEQKSKNKNEENKTMRILGTLRSNDTTLQSISTLIVIFTAVVGFFISIGRFLVYLVDIQYFNYWNIDMIFCENASFINNFIYMFCIVCVLILFVLFASRKFVFILLQCIIFVAFNILIGITEGINYGFDCLWLINYIIIPLVIYIIIRIYIYNLKFVIELKELLNKYLEFSALANSTLILIFSLFVALTIFGIAAVCFQKEYRIIKGQEIINQVVLYSTKDYYIVAECEEKNNILYINSNIQQKISTNDLITEIIEFDKVERIESKS